MMPKGVEHPTPKSGYRLKDGVRIPMMPKGVEHTPVPPKTPKARSENSDDAERR